ncbi:MAG: radical SAM protein [bacterium]
MKTPAKNPLQRELVLRAPDLPLFRLYRRLSFPALSPLEASFAVTYRCRNRCLTCNAWRSPDAGELNAAEYKRIFSSIGPPLLSAAITGGEPFMRSDLADVIAALCENNAPLFVKVHTCADAPKETRETLSDLLRAFPRVHFIVLLSLEGIGGDLDVMRGRSGGSYTRFLKTYRALRCIGSANLTVGFQVLVSEHNEEKAEELIRHAFSLYPDGVSLQVAFGSAELNVTATDVLPDVAGACATLETFSKSRCAADGYGKHRFLNVLNRLQARLTGRNIKLMRRTVPCFAGSAYVYVAPDGAVKDCSVAGREMGNLREADYDLGRILGTFSARRVRHEVRTSGCFCPMTELSLSNLLLTTRGFVRLAGSLI